MLTGHLGQVDGEPHAWRHTEVRCHRDEVRNWTVKEHQISLNGVALGIRTYIRGPHVT